MSRRSPKVSSAQRRGARGRDQGGLKHSTAARCRSNLSAMNRARVWHLLKTVTQGEAPDEELVTPLENFVAAATVNRLWLKNLIAQTRLRKLKWMRKSHRPHRAHVNLGHPAIGEIHLFSSTPPLEVLKLLIAYKKIGVIGRAYFSAICPDSRRGPEGTSRSIAF